MPEMCIRDRVSPIENVVISLETGEGLSINSSSNTVYVPKMGPGEKKAQQVDVQALFQTKDSKIQSPKITISCKYEYIDKTERKQSTATAVSYTHLQALGTVGQGAVRFSMSYYNTEEEMDQAVLAVREIAGSM